MVRFYSSLHVLRKHSQRERLWKCLQSVFCEYLHIHSLAIEMRNPNVFCQDVFNDRTADSDCRAGATLRNRTSGEMHVNKLHY